MKIVKSVKNRKWKHKWERDGGGRKIENMSKLLEREKTYIILHILIKILGTDEMLSIRMNVLKNYKITF